MAYPNVALKGRRAFCGVSDIVEPNKEWKTFKHELTGREWDYAFRRLFYTWSPDMTKGQFQDWVEIANRDQTAGWITPAIYGSPLMAPRISFGWKKALDERLSALLPDAKQRYELNYAGFTRRQGGIIAPDAAGGG